MADRQNSYERRSVVITGVNPYDVTTDVVKELVRRNDPPTIFVMGDAIVRYDERKLGDKSFSRLKPQGPNDLLHLVAEHIDFLSVTKDGERITNPPNAVMRMVKPAISPDLPALDRVVNVPYFLEDGGLVKTDGYSHKSRLYLVTNGFRLPSVPHAPTERQLKAAVKLIQDELLCDFPFVDDASRANYIGFLLTLTGRCWFGLSPLLVLDASTPGSGKGLLVDIASIISTGEPAKLQGLPLEEAEQRKVITGLLLEGRGLFAWDECPHITGKAFASLLTAEIYSDRILGGNQMLSVRNTFTQAACGNNVAVYGDLRRRVVPSRLEPQDAHPEKRADFKHPDLKGWARDHRPQLLAALMTMWRHWLALGKPKSTIAMGSYERWTAAVGGCLEVAGITGFLNNLDKWLSDSEPDDAGWKHFFIELAKMHEPGSPFEAKELARDVGFGRIHLPYLPKGYESHPAASIGNMLRGVRGRWWGEYRIDSSTTTNSSSGSRTWTLAKKPRQK
jgi:hypothetical protein